MKYKGIVFDVDGTAVPLGGNHASARLQRAIAAAQQDFVVAAATGRSYEYAKPVFESLGLKAPCVLLGGTAIMNPVTDEVIWNKPMSVAQADAILEQVAKYQSDTFIGTDAVSPASPLKDYRRNEHTVSVIYALEVPPDQAPKLIADIERIPDTVAHPTPAWVDGLVDVHITHAEATKEHSIQVLIERLGLKPDEVIGIGDSGNDLPIFKATGHHIAMGNATEALKAEANEIAPAQPEDGLAYIIEKYFLS